jgi:hypothetical protein
MDGRSGSFYRLHAPILADLGSIDDAIRPADKERAL